MNHTYNVSHFDLEPGAAEIIEICYQMIFFIIGTPVNMMAIWRQHRVRKHLSDHGSECRLVRLSLHLIVANLLVVCIYCLWRTYWFLNVVWYDGDTMCRIFSFMCAFPFHLWSNMVTAIAADMLCCVRSPLSSYRSGGQRVTVLILAAWFCAFFCSLPMIAFKGIVPIPGTGFYQCYSLLDPFEGFLFNTFHVCTVFYLPLLIILICYSVIGVTLRQQIKERRQMQIVRSADRRPPPPLRQTSRLSSRQLSRLSSLQSLFSRLNSMTSLGNGPEVSGHSFAAVQSVPRRSRGARTKRRFLRITLAIIGTFVLSWLPYQIMAVLRIVCEPFSECSEFSLKMNWTQAAMIASACINPFLYKFNTRGREAGGLKLEASSMHKESTSTMTSSVQRKITTSSYRAQKRSVIVGAPDVCSTVVEESSSFVNL